MHYKTKKTPSGWAVYAYLKGKSRFVKETDWPEGLKRSLTRTEADTILKSYNTAQKLKDREASRLGAKDRLRSEAERNCAWLPDDVVRSFEAIYMVGAEESKDNGKRLSMWKLVKKLIIDVNLDPTYWPLQPNPLYNWWKGHPATMDYIKRAMRLLNSYGHLFCQARGTSYSLIPKMPEQIRVEILDAFEELDREKKSLPLLVEQGIELKSKIKESYYNWVCIAWAFGLRPEEVDLLHVQVDPKGRQNWWWEGDVLVIDQPKLRKVRKRERYKRIPIFNEYQKDAVELIKRGDFQRPSWRTVREKFPKGVTLYGCRHGFTRFMEQLRQPMAKVSKWLGHRSIKTTEQYYRDHGLLARPEEDDEAA